MPGKQQDKKSFRTQNVADIIKLEQRDRISMSLSDKIADRITAFSGSMIYVGLHVIWFGAWMIVNFGLIRGFRPFDPFPFSLLTMIVSLEAIFLSAFVLISQNKQALQADKRAKVDLQVNMIAERENTKLIEMVEEIHQHLGIHKREDKEIKALKKVTDVNEIANQLDKAEERVTGKKSKGPKSAVDTSR